MSQTAVEEIRPWERPFWKAAPGKSVVLFYFVLIHLLAIIGLILFPLPSLKVLGVALLLCSSRRVRRNRLLSSLARTPHSQAQRVRRTLLDLLGHLQQQRCSSELGRLSSPSSLPHRYA